MSSSKYSYLHRGKVAAGWQRRHRLAGSVAVAGTTAKEGRVVGRRGSRSDTQTHVHVGCMNSIRGRERWWCEAENRGSRAGILESSANSSGGATNFSTRMPLPLLPRDFVEYAF